AHRALIVRLLDLLPQTVRRLVYFYLLSHKATLYPVAVEGAPLWERVFIFLLYPVWRRLMARGLDLSPDLLDEAPVRIREACDLSERELSRGGTRFMGGEYPNAVDIVFSALMAPIVFPPRYGATLPPFGALPTELQAFIEEMRSRPAGSLALETYE